jgi:hypothetical protein
MTKPRYRYNQRTGVCELLIASDTMPAFPEYLNPYDAYLAQVKNAIRVSRERQSAFSKFIKQLNG